jgi:ATP-binding cassette subfamily B protein/subfamily B ATP-binding cassette protein MsbA
MQAAKSSKHRELEPPVKPADKRPAGDKSKRRTYLRSYVDWLWPYRFTLGGLFALALVAALMDLVWPLAIKGIINGLVPGHAAAPLNRLAAGVIVLLLGKQCIDTFRSYRTQVLNAKVIFRLRGRLYAKLLGLPLGELGELKTGGIVSRLSSDVDAVSGLVQSAVISPSVAVLRVVLTMAIMIKLSWQLAVAALILLPPIAVASVLWSRRVRPIYRRAQADRTNVDAGVSETFGGIRVVRAFRREPAARRGYAVGHHTIIRRGLRAQRLELILEAVWGVMIPCTSLLVVWYGGRLVLTGRGSVGNIFAFQVYAVLLLQPVWMIVQSISGTQRALAAMERVFDVLAMPADKPDVDGAVDAADVVREVRLDSVGFEYRPGTAVLSDVSLTARGGQTVALVGPSGAGKTTLTDLIGRFHDPTSGAILLNGTDLRRLRLSSYRRLLAVVPQETFLFDGSVADNIAYGRRGATRYQVEDAARRANAEEFIVGLPEKYDTTIGERGFKLSGGQRQRISIARAILADPQILILDEATSNLDTHSEQLIQASLTDLFTGRTTFVIAHRLSTIAGADLIVALEGGRVREVGTHESLMADRGFYFDMVERQRGQFGEQL